jgi:hypothetical protein
MQSPVQFILTLHEEDVDPNVLHNLATNLGEFCDETVRPLPSGQEETGGKGDPITWGALVLVAMPAVLPQIIQFLQNFLIRRHEISIKAPSGASISFTTSQEYSKKEILALVSELHDLTESDPDSDIETQS